MEKTSRSDIATFPELFDGIDQFIDELGRGVLRISIRLAIVTIPGSALLILALSKTS